MEYQSSNAGMHLRILVLVFLLAGVEVVYAAYPPDPTAPSVASVVRVYDGDTILIRAGRHIERVRLLGIDSPEIRDKKTGVAQCYSREATDALRGMLAKNENQLVWLKTDPLSHNRDRYGRLLRYVYGEYSAPDNSINAMLLKKGFARVYRKEYFTQKTFFINLEKDSSRRRVGLWSVCQRQKNRLAPL